MRYGILMKPNNNIPYFEKMKEMCVCELNIIVDRLGLEADNFKYEVLGKAQLLTFETEKELKKEDMKHIYNLSFYYSLFELEGEMLKPIHISEKSILNEDISTRLKYTGKTNETFTRQMLNIAIFASDFYNEEKLNVLDPMCSRGTTLYEAMLLGHDGYGVEMDKKSVKELETYFTRYLTEGDYEFDIKRGKSVQNKQEIGQFLNYEFSMKDDNEIQRLKVLRGDSTEAYKHYNSKNIHVVVADLPYGVQHKGKNKKGSYRDLEELMDLSLQSWHKMLLDGGTVAFSWNTYTNSRADMAKLLEKNGFEVQSDDNYRGFLHRVSQAINRDIIVGKKK